MLTSQVQQLPSHSILSLKSHKAFIKQKKLHKSSFFCSKFSKNLIHLDMKSSRSNQALCTVCIPLLIAFTQSSTTTFHFIPSNGSELSFNSSGSWEVTYNHFECIGGPDVCLIRIPNAKLTTPLWGSKEQKLADYLSRQGLPGSDYANSTSAVNTFKIYSKP